MLNYLLIILNLSTILCVPLQIVNMPNGVDNINNGTQLYDITSLDGTNEPNLNSFRNEESLNFRPIIGVLAQEKSRGMRRTMGNDTTSYIAASYVKYLESAGARVVPILINQSEDYYLNLTKYLNGILFPGGSAPITNISGYGMAGQILYNIAITSDPPIPIWATCLGFEMLLYLGANQVRPLSACNASNVADPLKLQPEWESSELLGRAPAEIIDYVVTENVTSNFHKWCVLPQNFSTNLGLNESFKILSTSFDLNGLEYISTVEHRTLPIYATQWHPEKPQFEWGNTNKLNSIPHSLEAIEVGQYMANFFVNKARENPNQFPSEEDEIEYLIYNYSPVYSAISYKSSFQQIYLF